ncbi:MAG: septation protein SpoVG family protein [Elusimicrobiota bacterium]
MKFKICLIVLAFLCLVFSGLVFAESFLEITSVVSVHDNTQTRARIIAGGFLVIEDIILYEDKSILLPHYKVIDGFELPQVEIIDPDLKNKIIESVRSGAETRQINTAIEFKISEINILKKNSSRKANAVIVFNNSIAVHCGVMQGKKGLWVAWPAKKDEAGKYGNIVYVLNKKLKSDVEKAIIDKYLSKIN